ncbi:PREDICTED: uncharacterized protein LOC104815196 [Tarenaya hassleriana]|uniref:uncharacterized protein LOC104815196 n=1 Tax=Tarenaya hassleriana TaxID=28532 RepID=UPI00053C318B|nr:PREDICTED: uncharacterized protein LOC104815196 [Tarenaya hassleriana]
MWTISDFPAYSMLSGWTTHGRLACPYCMDETDAFWLPNERKTSWFDCHRRFLSRNHALRRNKKNFRKNRVVSNSSPLELTGDEILFERIEDCVRSYGLGVTTEVGGNGHLPIQGYGEYHNWHKKSIFWELPYWRHHKLRHNLDVMHIEKNFFDNIINTVLNVPQKSKDNPNSRKDIKSICLRKELELTEDGKAPVPVFRVFGEAQKNFFRWLKDDIKFPDGYSSNLARCVDIGGNKLTGMKSHDCHVFMQRLLPIAFAELLPHHVHESLSGISSFFRVICSRTLKLEDITMLKQNIVLVDVPV